MSDVRQVGDLNHQLMQLARTLQVMRQHASTHNPAGVPWATYMLLFHLVKDGPRRTGALADCVHADISTVSRQVDLLVRLGLVERRADPDDGRATLLVPTEAGGELYGRIRDGREQLLAGVLAGWDPAELDTLTTLLARLNVDLVTGLPRLLEAMAADAADATAHLTGDRA